MHIRRAERNGLCKIFLFLRTRDLINVEQDGVQLKSESARQMRYRSVIRVSLFRFFDAQSGQTRRLAEVGSSPRLNSFIPALLFRRTARHKRPLSPRASTFNFRLTSLSLLSDIPESRRVESRPIRRP